MRELPLKLLLFVVCCGDFLLVAATLYLMLKWLNAVTVVVCLLAWHSWHQCGSWHHWRDVYRLLRKRSIE
jgi:hypothetical protein